MSHLSIRRLLAGWVWLALVSLSACGTVSAPPAARITMSPGSGAVDILWAGIPRPAPLAPLSHGAMLLPVQIEGTSDARLYMQFDVGSPSTVLYSGKWRDIAARRAEPYAERVGVLRFRLGNLDVTAREVAVIARESDGVDWSGKKVEVIGTIGSDLIDGRVVVLDFAKDSVRFAQSRESLAAPGLTYRPFQFQGRRILLPATFEGKETQVMYDSGSSAFAWLTNESTFKRLANPGAKVETYPVRSWGNVLTAHTVATDVEVTIGGITQPVRELSHIEGMGVLQQAAVSMSGLGGMVGNKLFLGRKLILDTGRLEFAVE
jgi:hypothetical protein